MLLSFWNFFSIRFHVLREGIKSFQSYWSILLFFGLPLDLDISVPSVDLISFFLNSCYVTALYSCQNKLQLQCANWCSHILLESNCWQEWLIFSDIFFFLMKSGCIDFVDFVDKLVSRLIEDDHHILRTNHVTWLLAQIIRVELVMNALNNDSRKVL